HQGEQGRVVRVLTDTHGPFEPGECPAQVALAEGQTTDPPRGHHEARGMSHRLSDPAPFVPEGPTLGEGAQLGMTPGKQGIGLHEVIGLHEWHGSLAQALAVPRLVEGYHGLLEASYRPTIVALHLVDMTEAHVRQRLQDDLTAGCGERQSRLSGSASLIIRAHTAEMV